MSGEHDPPRWRDSGGDPALRRALGTAQRGLSDPEASALAQRIEHAVRAKVIAEAQPGRSIFRGSAGRWLGVVGIACVAAVWLAANQRGREARGIVGELRNAATQPAERGADTVTASAGSGRDATMQSERRGAGSAEAEPVAALLAEGSFPAQLEQPELRRSGSGDRAGSKRTTAQRAARSLAASAAPDKTGVPEQTQVPPELQLLTSAQSALRSNPALALELADEHAREYPGGRFAQEREAIAIEALFELGREHAARTRADAFIARYPRSVQASSFAKRLEPAVGP
jgi:hypothetical protein